MDGFDAAGAKPGECRLLEPRVQATFAIPEEICGKVACGQRCYARLQPNESIAGRFYRWLQQRLNDEWGV
jgi:hypothetical protein